MGPLRNVAREISQFKSRGVAFVELTIGAPLARRLIIDKSSSAYPIGSIGNASNVEFGISVLRELGVPTDQNFVSVAKKESSTFNHVILSIYFDLPHDELERAAWGRSQKINRSRALIGLYAGSNHNPIMMLCGMKKNEAALVL